MSAGDGVVVGGGVIGLATAWRCAQRGSRVTVVDRTPGQGALLQAIDQSTITVVRRSVRRIGTEVAPLLGRSGMDGSVYATGHYRNGILLTPVTADEIAKLIATGETSEVIAPFPPDRHEEAAQ